MGLTTTFYREPIETSRPKNGVDVKYTGIQETIERRTDH
jgi:hypothetical protein